MLADRLAEDNIPTILQRHVHGYGGGAVLHQQEHHGLLGLVSHHGDALGERGEERVQSLAPLTWEQRWNGVKNKTKRLLAGRLKLKLILIRLLRDRNRLDS